MKNEERANWIRRFFVLLVAAGVVAGAWFYQQQNKEEPQVAAEVPEKEFDLVVYHFHEPGNPESEQLAKHYEEITRRYADIVLVKSIDIKARPLDAAKESIGKPPKSVMAAAGQRVFEFEGSLPYPKLEATIDQILRGLKRVDKDWRPEVKGMVPVRSGETPAASP